jgi:iron complex transport system ATP-binding protein
VDVTLHAHGLGLKIPGTSRWLVRDLDLQVCPGQLTAVVGPNGSGKTTLLRALVGARPVDAGRIRLGPTPLGELAPRARAQTIAYLPQSSPLVHDLRVSQLVALGRAPYLSRLRGPGPEDRAAVRDALAAVGTDDLADRRVSTLSGGERQRVMLARMLATGAKVLVMDEPTAALDIAHVLSLLALVRRLADEGHAVVTALHDLDLARRHADTALCLLGDGDGGHRAGSADGVLTPEGLADVFGVDVTLRDGTLRFSLPTASD